MLFDVQMRNSKWFEVTKEILLRNKSIAVVSEGVFSCGNRSLLKIVRQVA